MCASFHFLLSFLFIEFCQKFLMGVYVGAIFILDIYLILKYITLIQ